MDVVVAPLTNELALRVGIAAAECLAALVQSDGSFAYFSTSEGAQIRAEKYNLIRHAGCVWALNQAASALLFDEPYNVARRRALLWLVERNLAPSPQSGACISQSGKAALGATALAVLALLSYEESCESVRGALNPQLVALVSCLCEHMLSQVRDDGDFIHVIDVRSGAIEESRCSYYTGEALLAMFAAIEWCPQLTRLCIAQELFGALARLEYGVEDQNHWMMYAAERSFLLEQQSMAMVYADRLAESIIRKPGYRDARLSTSVACRTEALLCYLRMMRSAGRANASLFRRVQTEVLTNLELQLESRLSNGAFCKRAGEQIVRIDYLQHNLTAFLGHAVERYGLKDPIDDFVAA